MTTTPAPTPSTPAPAAADAGIEAAQAALAGEHACVYGYGVVGAHLPGDAETARDALATHRTRRDELTALIVAAGSAPVAAEPGYALPSPVTDAASARALGVLLEERLGALYADVVGAATTPELRAFAVRGVVAATVQAIAWGGAPTAFPGLDGRV
ncbi:ferritin-like domain-containing protein [Jiangella endophytica]|uniref:ferritin-like domain-containing protein n=1 Tax=Jiangella endophytica TaxID=1623398 RepID=UPI0018E52813|nr:ferritin-like domain-containing protein [Jiangella endophytica]